MSSDFPLRLNQLVTEPEFTRLAALSTEPNFFQVVGQSRFERWHSNFWGWLLDPGGSHRLESYVLNRLISLLFSDTAIKPKDSEVLENLLLRRVSIDGIEVRPNEYDHSELTVEAGRLDIYASGRLAYTDGVSQDLNVLVELKVESRTRAEQSIVYADWLLSEHPDDVNVLVYILPNREIRSSPAATVGDSRWFCVGFQQLHDEILLPVLDHPHLNPRVAQFISEYVKNLRIPYRGNKMALTQEERELARALYDRYSDVFETISEALRDEGIELELEDAIAGGGGRSSGRMAVTIAGQLFEGKTVPDLFTACLTYLVDSGAVERRPLPFGKGTNRYIIAQGPNPVHPSGRDFFAPVEYEGYVLESHMERQRAFTVLSQLCEYLELDFTVVES